MASPFPHAQRRQHTGNATNQVNHQRQLAAPSPAPPTSTPSAVFQEPASRQGQPPLPPAAGTMMPPPPPPPAPTLQPGRISKLVATTPGGETISIEIPAGLQQSWVQAMDMSPLDSVHCDSPGFNNFMMTLSPIMQLSSPQPTMSPREQPQPMSPIIEGEEVPFGFMGNGPNDKHLNLISMVEGCSLSDDSPAGPDPSTSMLAIALDSPSAQAAAGAAAAAVGAAIKERSARNTSNKENAHSGSVKSGGHFHHQPHPMAASRGLHGSASSSSSSSSFSGTSLSGGSRPPSMPYASTGPRKCNCRKSKCLKLYCECFAGGFYCNDECGCMECNNTKDFEVIRGKAIQSIMSRNPNAFTEKIQYIEPVEGEDVDGGAVHATPAHVRGCHCKKSFCIKKYCECFFAGVYCGENCKCEGCKNYMDSPALESSRASSAAAAAARGKDSATTNMPTSSKAKMAIDQQMMQINTSS